MKKFILLLLLPALIYSGCESKKHSVPPAETTESENKPVPVQAEELISEYETKIYDKVKNRTNNLNICAKTLDGHVVKPGEEFSFNETVGQRTKEKGYLKAITFDINGEKKKDYGGGICQISTTLNMAVQKAGLSVTERHNHKREIPYEQLGNDAAISYNGQDYKFVNNKDYSIRINVTVNEDISVIVKLYKI